ncbi:MAG: alpha beta-propellor repeat-containing integrin [Candidatus Magnetoglobus multicellularis str. Araruama]|uniref:Alpha beta-propellor repeat-containing integrin n=1 Tax=Candidatus Magnetoglobus multicellularis str. Araruama TaxID=890399 RepID=A0A1V1NU79_9BACT|nr:MAG: alpha beta-propellor repeat-containing integrin [Candidatus Magnetoglobus multicellularis str. Araruama]
MFKISDWNCEQFKFGRNEHQYFGKSVALSDSYAIVGAPNYNSNYGYIKIYQLNSGAWTNIKNITGQSSEYWGNTVDITDQYAMIGSYYYNSQQGKAYIYTLESWTKIDLRPNDPANSDYFGWSVALNNNYAIVGAYYDDDNGSNSGSAYVFQNNSGTWKQVAKMTASDGYNNEYYGYNVSMSANHFFIGAYNKASSTGAVYVYPNSRYTISGYIYDKDLNPVPLAVVNFTNASSAVSDGNGFYSNTVFLGWSGDVTVQKGHYLFSPSSHRYEKFIRIIAIKTFITKYLPSQDLSKIQQECL